MDGKLIYERIKDLIPKDKADALYLFGFFDRGEMSLQIFDDWLRSDSLYLLDEPEVSLSPQNQVLLSQKINFGARFMNNQYIIATHSPFMLGTLDAKIYNLDSKDFNVCRWSELENVKYFYDFFKKRQHEFEIAK